MPYDAMGAALARPAAAPKRKSRGRPFAPSQSGKPSGKPSGTRNRVSLMLEAMLEGEAQAIGRKLVEVAKSGEGRALKALHRPPDAAARGRADRRPVSRDQDRGRCAEGLGRHVGGGRGGQGSRRHRLSTSPSSSTCICGRSTRPMPRRGW